MDKPPKPLPKPLPKPPGGVPIIGQGPQYDPDTMFMVDQFKFLPPRTADHGYAMAVVMINGTPDMRKTARAFGMKLAAYLAEDCELGDKHSIVMIQPAEDGGVEFVVARSTADDPKTKH